MASVPVKVKKPRARKKEGQPSAPDPQPPDAASGFADALPTGPAPVGGAPWGVLVPPGGSSSPLGGPRPPWGAEEEEEEEEEDPEEADEDEEEPAPKRPRTEPSY